MLMFKFYVRCLLEKTFSYNPMLQHLYSVSVWTPCVCACLFKALLLTSPVCSDWSALTGLSRYCHISSDGVFLAEGNDYTSCDLITWQKACWLVWSNSFSIPAGCTSLWIQPFEAFTGFKEHLDLFYNKKIYMKWNNMGPLIGQHECVQYRWFGVNTNTLNGGIPKWPRLTMSTSSFLLASPMLLRAMSTSFWPGRQFTQLFRECDTALATWNAYKP